MGLALHNSIAVFEGYIGKKSPFIRTPKFNISKKKKSWKKNIYRIKKINTLTWIELVLCLYFLFGIGLGFYLNNFGMLLFHTMLTFGYGTVVYYSFNHAK